MGKSASAAVIAGGGVELQFTVSKAREFRQQQVQEQFLDRFLLPHLQEYMTTKEADECLTHALRHAARLEESDPPTPNQSYTCIFTNRLRPASEMCRVTLFGNVQPPPSSTVETLDDTHAEKVRPTKPKQTRKRKTTPATTPATASKRRKSDKEGEPCPVPGRGEWSFLVSREWVPWMRRVIVALNLFEWLDACVGERLLLDCLQLTPELVAQLHASRTLNSQYHSIWTKACLECCTMLHQ